MNTHLCACMNECVHIPGRVYRLGRVCEGVYLGVSMNLGQ